MALWTLALSSSTVRCQMGDGAQGVTCLLLRDTFSAQVRVRERLGSTATLLGPCRQHARQEGRRSSRLGCVPARATAPGLSGGAIAGIVIGVLVLLAIIGGVFFMMKKKAAVTPK